MEAKGVNIEDLGITYVKLSFGRYLIDGNLVTVPYKGDKVQVKNIKDIRPVHSKNVISYYVKQGTKEVITTDEYNTKMIHLENKSKYNSEGNMVWDSLEDEFNYRKFCKDWDCIFTDVQIIEEPIKVEIENILYDTGNKYIVSGLINARTEDTLYTYKRESALVFLMEQCFAKLKMERNINAISSDTARTKTWNNSDKGGIRWAVAFGTYIFDKKWDNVHNEYGTLKDLRKKYNEDKKEIEDIIHRQFYINFGNIDQDNYNFNRLLLELYNIKDNTYKLICKKNSLESQRKIVNKISNVIKEIEEKFKEGYNE